MTHPRVNMGGSVPGADGHLYVGDERIRFLGINITIGDCYPDTSEADAIAGRLAKFGINLVRIHLVDQPFGSPSIIDYARRDSRHVDSENFDRLDYLVSALKRNGIYVLLALLDGRQFFSSDGLPGSIDTMNPKDQQIPAMFDSRMLELQKEYACSFLARPRPSSGASFLDDPAVAFVEVLNEQGLLHAWRQGRMDVLPSEFRSTLAAMWGGFLAQKYGTFAALRTAWGDISEPLSATDIANGHFSSGSLPPWWLSVQPPAGATGSIVQSGYGPGVNAVHIRVTDPSDVDWSVQLGYITSIEGGHPYTIRFSAKAFRGARLSISLTEQGGAWQALYRDDEELSEGWQDYQFTFVSAASFPKVVFSFTGFAARRGEYHIARVSLRQGGSRPGLLPAESDFSRIGIFLTEDSWRRTEAAKRDWVSFLLGKEREYWTAMNRFLKGELQCEALTLGTQVGYSVPSLLSEFDIVDSHAYWQYPVAETNWWDSPWRIHNESMIGQPDGGTIGELSVKRVAGKPFMVSEYNHPFPSSFGAESYVVLSTYAALQDWDAIIAFQYGDGEGDPRDGMIDTFFEIGNDVGKWASLPHAALIFRRYDVSSARRTVVVPVRESDEVSRPAQRCGLQARRCFRGWRSGKSGSGPQDRNGRRRRRGSLGRVGRRERPEHRCPRDAVGYRRAALEHAQRHHGRRHGENQGCCRTLHREEIRSGRHHDTTPSRHPAMGGDLDEPGRRRHAGTGGCEDPADSVRLLVQHGARLQSVSVRRVSRIPPSAGVDITFAEPGNAPTVAEGIAARIHLPYPASQVRVHALDATGAPKAEVPVTAERGGAAFEIDAAQRTIWYQVEVIPAGR